MMGAPGDDWSGLPKREFLSLTEIASFVLDGVARDDDEVAKAIDVVRETARGEWGDHDGPRWLLEQLSWIRDEFWKSVLFKQSPMNDRKKQLEHLKKARAWLSMRGTNAAEAIKLVEVELKRRLESDLRRRRFVDLLFREAARKSVTIWAPPQASGKDHPDGQLAKIPSEFFAESGDLSIHRALATNPSFRCPRDNAEGYSAIHLVNEATGEEYVKPRLTYDDAIKLCKAFNDFKRVAWHESKLPTRTWLSLSAALMWVLTRDAALTERLADDPRSDEGVLLKIVTRLAAEEVYHGFEPTRFFPSAEDAWHAVRSLIAEEKIEAEGPSIERRGISAAVTTEYPSQRIPSGDARSFKLFDGVPGVEPKTALAIDRPNRFDNGSPFGQGRYWFDVRLKAADVFGEFPPETDAGAIPDQQTPQQPHRGRRKGSGSYESLDQPLLDEMATLMERGEAVSPEAAARQVANKARGAGTTESKTERLAKRFRSNRSSARNKSD
jgi:hypothetical protein